VEQGIRATLEEFSISLNVIAGYPDVFATTRMCRRLDDTVKSRATNIRRTMGCSGRCQHSIVRTAVRREIVDGLPQREPQQARIPLGLVMLAQLGEHPQFRSAGLAAYARTGELVLLVQECGWKKISCTGLSVHMGCPVAGLGGFVPERMVRSSTRLVEEFDLAVASDFDRTLYLALRVDWTLHWH